MTVIASPIPFAANLGLIQRRIAQLRWLMLLLALLLWPLAHWQGLGLPWLLLAPSSSRPHAVG